VSDFEDLHFIRQTGGGIIFCEATPVDELADDPDELDLLGRGYRWCQCFSPACPQGEGGHVPMSHLVPISDAAFEEARHSGWQTHSWA